MFSELKAELDSIMDRDPAARSRAEVFFLYSGFRAVRSYRVAHWFYLHNHKFIARWLSQHARHKTGIEIHPGAKIGRGLFIDHGMGVVIGETTEIGDNCTLYQGVTLGGTGKDHGKRHPTLGNNVLVGAGAKILGPFRVGDNARVAAGAVVLDEVPPNATAVGVPARIVRLDGIRPANLDQIHIGDPVAQQLCYLGCEIGWLQKQVEALTGRPVPGGRPSTGSRTPAGRGPMPVQQAAPGSWPEPGGWPEPGSRPSAGRQPEPLKQVVPEDRPPSDDRAVSGK